MISEIWEWITDTVGGFFDFVGGLFEGIGEVSTTGIIVGGLTAFFVFATRKLMINHFLENMTPFSAIFWGVATYISCFVVGYLIGMKIENS